MNWPPIEADGPVVAEARRILRDPTKAGRYWSLNQWRQFVFDKIKEYGLDGQPTSEARMAVLGPVLNQYGAAPQRGTVGRWTGRIYFPPPPPKVQDPNVEESYWWDFQRFVDIVQDPWGSSSWVWIIRQDPGPPPQSGEDPKPPPVDPPPPAPEGLDEVRRVVVALSHRVVILDERVKALEDQPTDDRDAAVEKALDRLLPVLRATGRTQSTGGFLGHSHHCDLTIERKP